jgi:hypothetical protein
MNEFKLLVDICLFQGKPQDFPYSPSWMAFTAFMLCAAIFISYPVQEQTSLVVGLIAIVHVAAYGFAIWGALWYRTYPGNARYLAFLGQAAGITGIVLALFGSEAGLRLGMSLVLAAGFLLILAMIFKNLGELTNAVSRFVQTITAIFGTAAVLQFVTWPFVTWLTRVENTPDAQIPLLVILGLGIWTFAVAVNVNRHALEVSIGQSILITLGTQIFTAAIVFILFGAVMV